MSLNMTDVLKKELQFLHYFVKLNDSEKRSIVKNLTKSQTKAISQILLNAIKGSFKIDKSKLKDLKRYKISLYKVADKKTSLQQKRNLISRRIHQITVVLKEGLKWIIK